MILVTGSGRSGTSLMMQSLGLLGLPLAGVPFHDDFPVHELNPKGYYDLPFNTMLLGVGKEYEGSVVKLFGKWLKQADHTIVSHVIVCRRKDTAAQDASLKNAFQKETQVRTASVVRAKFLENIPEDCEYRRVRKNNYREVRNFTNKHTLPTHTVWFEDFKEHPVTTLKDLTVFLGIEGVDLEDAINNVDND